jgi:diguanylate cyclase (GGDEF)-like protein
MLTSVKKILRPLTLFPDTIEQIDFESDVSVYLILGTALVFAFLVHCGLFIFSLVLDCFPLIVFNSLSLSAYCVCFFRLRKKHYTFIGIVITVEVLGYTCFSIYWLGFLNYDFFYLLIALVMQIAIPYAGTVIRMSLGILIGIAVLLIIVFKLCYTGPGYVETSILPLAAYNIAVGFLGITLELLIGNIIKKVIEVSRQLRMETLETHAYTDSLTGLYNRHYAEQYFSQLAKTASRVDNVVAMLDIDDFKHINDSHGHAAGDKVLVALAALMLSEFRKTDTVIRWGGEEFLIILNSVNSEQARSVLNKLRERIKSSPVDIGATSLSVRVTIGLEPLDTGHIQESIAGCDEKLYQGKRNGKDQVVG